MANVSHTNHSLEITIHLMKAGNRFSVNILTAKHVMVWLFPNGVFSNICSPIT